MRRRWKERVRGSLKRAVVTWCERWVLSCRTLMVGGIGWCWEVVLSDGMGVRILLGDGEEVP